MTSQRHDLSYAPGLDGLRAVACAAVFFYHLGLHVRGGFLGVDVFFCLSGYLITSLLLRELRSKRAINLRGFWRRRVYRIVPLLVVVSATWAAWGVRDYSAVGHWTVIGAGSSMLFVVNWMVVHNSVAAGVLNGNWSVAVEEQFYLTWPLLLTILYRRIRSERSIALVVAGAAVALAVHRFVIAPQGWVRVWFATDTQADALLAGCAVGLGLRCSRRWIAKAAGCGLGALLLFSPEATITTMRFWIPAAVICTALLLPWLNEHPGLLGSGPVAAIGRRSYGLYLWGCPIAYLARYRTSLPLGPRCVVAVVATAVVSEMTYRYVETPLRRRGRCGAPSRAYVDIPLGAAT